MPTLQKQDANRPDPHPLRRKIALPRTAEHEHRHAHVHEEVWYLRALSWDGLIALVGQLSAGRVNKHASAHKSGEASAAVAFEQ